jgi:hypothetical protein
MGNKDIIIARKNALSLSNMGKKYHIPQTSLSNLVWKMLLELIARQIAT